jgi:hypothetical protein
MADQPMRNRPPRSPPVTITTTTAAAAASTTSSSFPCGNDDDRGERERERVVQVTRRKLLGMSLDDLVVEKPLGQGSFGAVFKCSIPGRLSPTTSSTTASVSAVALKILFNYNNDSSAAVARTNQNEWTVLSSLPDHRNVVAVLHAVRSARLTEALVRHLPEEAQRLAVVNDGDHGDYGYLSTTTTTTTTTTQQPRRYCSVAAVVLEYLPMTVEEYLRQCAASGDGGLQRGEIHRMGLQVAEGMHHLRQCVLAAVKARLTRCACRSCSCWRCWRRRCC